MRYACAVALDVPNEHANLWNLRRKLTSVAVTFR